MLLVVISPSSWTAVAAESVLTVVSGLLSLVDDGEGEVALAVDFAAADPNLNADDAHLGVSLGLAEVDVCAEGVEWSTTLFEHLVTGHLGAVETATDLDLDALSLVALCGCESELDGSAVSDAAFELTRDVVCDDCGVEIGALDFVDVDLYLFACELSELFFELVDLFAILADDETGLGGEDGDGDHLQGALDDDAGEAGFGETLVEVVADLLVLDDFLAEVLAAVPS